MMDKGDLHLLCKGSLVKLDTLTYLNFQLRYKLIRASSDAFFCQRRVGFTTKNES